MISALFGDKPKWIRSDGYVLSKAQGAARGQGVDVGGNKQAAAH